MRRIHKPLQRIRTTIRLVHGKQRHAVITPAMIAGERGYRHQFHMRYTKVHQIIQPGNGRIQRSFGRERPNVQLIDHATRERRRLKFRVAPGKRILVIEARHPMNAIRLRLRPRVRIKCLVVVNQITVIRPCCGLIDFQPPPALFIRPLHR